MRSYVGICALVMCALAATSTPAFAAPSISPKAVTMDPGDVVDFSSGTSWKLGTITWKATGGTIDNGGLYRAGSVPGTYTVTVTQRGVSSHATVTIVGPAPAPAPEPQPAPAPAPAPPPVTIFPGDAVLIQPGENIQTVVNAHAAGTTFVIKAGVHRRQTIRPKAGMTFIGEPGAVLDGENATATAIVGQDVNDVTIRGLRITRYAPATTTGALDAIDTTGWVVENNEIDNNVNGLARSYGVRLGSQMIVRGNKIHHNGYVGIDGYKSYDTVI